MSNTWKSFSEQALPSKYQQNHKSRIQSSQNLYFSPRNYDFTHKKLQLESKLSQQSIASRPRFQYMCFQRNKQRGMKDRYTEKIVEQKQKEAAQQKIGRIQKIRPIQYYSKTAKSSKKLQYNSGQSAIYKQKLNDSQKQKQVRHYKQQIKSGYLNSEYNNQKLQITFNVESTEPDQPEKQLNNQYYNFQISNKVRINRNALQIWKKKKIERQIKQKEGEYRSLIRSLSKKKQKQQSEIKNKMNEVLNQLFVLTKQVKK